MDCDNCKDLGYSGNSKACGYLLHGGETKYITNNRIAGPCPKEVWKVYKRLVKEGKIVVINDEKQ